MTKKAGEVTVPITAAQARRIAVWLWKFKPTEILERESPAHRHDRLRVARFLRKAARYERRHVNLPRDLAEIVTQAGVGAMIQSPNVDVVQLWLSCASALAARRGRPRLTLERIQRNDVADRQRARRAKQAVQLMELRESAEWRKRIGASFLDAPLPN